MAHTGVPVMGREAVSVFVTQAQRDGPSAEGADGATPGGASAEPSPRHRRWLRGEHFEF